VFGVGHGDGDAKDKELGKRKSCDSEKRENFLCPSDSIITHKPYL